MSLRAYLEYRRQGIGKAWAYAGMTAWCWKAGLRAALCVAALSAYTWASALQTGRDEFSKAARVHAARADHLQAVWLSCLNNKSVWLDGELHLCTLDNTKLRAESFQRKPKI